MPPCGIYVIHLGKWFPLENATLIQECLIFTCSVKDFSIVKLQARVQNLVRFLTYRETIFLVNASFLKEYSHSANQVVLLGYKAENPRTTYIYFLILQVHRIESLIASSSAKIHSENAKVTITACILVLAPRLCLRIFLPHPTPLFLLSEPSMQL